VTLTPDDLAYMRETAAESRPTEAELRRRLQGRTPTGGTTTAYAEGEPIRVRLDGTPDNVPAQVAQRMQGQTTVKVVLDQVMDVRDGDQVWVSPTEVYEIATDGDPDRWSTAQLVWARRVAYPPRTT